jgi:hypothetical protein
VKHTKIQVKNEHFYSDNSWTGYVPPSKAQKRELFLKVYYMIVFWISSKGPNWKKKFSLKIKHNWKKDNLIHRDSLG